MRFGNPVEPRIYLTRGTVDGKPRWFRSQPWGPVKFDWEPPLGPHPHFNRGMDIARGPAGCGDRALALQDGVVLYAGGIRTTIGGITKVSLSVLVYHGGGHATGIGHLQGLSVAQGDRVRKGERTGAIGATGWATGCHADVVYKTDFPAGLVGAAAANAFYADPGKGGKGKLTDIWPHLEQNAPKPTRVRLRLRDGTRIRTGPSTEAGIFAETRLSDRTIRRARDGEDIGSLEASWPYGGTVPGGEWELPTGETGSDWVRIKFGARYRHVADGLAIVVEP